ncbi:MAG: tRNA threonylcarbamoyladenosine biosynthesis protein TsaE [Tenericutes bacterium ADurb.Bin239]|jgi:tRNA threonylcarbamoyladenosine biosynthesis protein TsaE|nr:MAG: tRNA threonylcarbamoyladenosine biosynthesis protein TsaE [Tenericutes bacterium ADurb.Bin239]
MKHEFKSISADQTIEFGKRLAALLKLGDIVLLTGDLGAGKTTITKGIAKGLNITEKVNSPTFNILKIYLKGDKPLFHIDAYRLEDDKRDIGLDEYIGEAGITVIEWPMYIKHLVPSEALEIKITHCDLTSRNIVISGSGHYTKVVSVIAKEFK